MLNKINSLILTGKTSFKRSRSNWISEKTNSQLFNFLHFYKQIETFELKRIDENQLSIACYDFNKNLTIFGTINLY